MEYSSPLSESQVQRLIAAAKTLRERALVEFFYATGCRLSEARYLRIEGTLTFEPAPLALLESGERHVLCS